MAQHPLDLNRSTNAFKIRSVPAQTVCRRLVGADWTAVGSVEVPQLR